MLSTLVEEKVAKIYKATFLQKLMQLLLAKNNKPYVLRCTNVKNIESEVLILHPHVLGCCKHRNNNPPAFLNRTRKKCDYAGQHIFALCADLQKTEQKQRIHINIYINN
jgi:hypothetical protein